jgi:hypothetical protein
MHSLHAKARLRRELESRTASRGDGSDGQWSAKLNGKPSRKSNARAFLWTGLPPGNISWAKTGAGRLVLYLVRAALGQVSEHSFEAREI